MDPYNVNGPWRSPIQGFENLPPLPDDRAADGKSYENPPTGVLSKSYEAFAEPLDRGQRGGFDVHVYYVEADEGQKRYARELWERIRREFPELRIYRLWDKPVGPHPVAMFEINVFTPAQFGALIPWLVVWRGPLSVLVHPNTTEPEQDLPPHAREARNHTLHAFWLGDRFPISPRHFQPLDGGD